MSDALNFDHFPFRGPLPAGWATVALEVIAKECESGFPSGKHNSSARGIPHVRPMNINRQGNLDFTATRYVEEMSPKLLRERDVIFNNTNSPDLVGKTTVISSPQVLAFSNHMTRIALENDIDERYVAAQLHALWSFGYFRHRCVNHVNQASISSEPLLRTVPLQLAPKEEQARIADALDELLSDIDAGVEALERAKVKLKLYRASVLKAAVTGDLTADWRIAHPEVEPASILLERILKERRHLWEEQQLAKFQASGKVPPGNWKTKYKQPMHPNAALLPQLPEGWCWVTFDMLIQAGPQNGLYLPAAAYGQGNEILRIDDYQRGSRKHREDLKQVSASGEDCVRYSLNENDLVINRVNSMTHLGKCLLVPGDMAGVLFESNMMRIQITRLVNSTLILEYLNSEHGRLRLVADAKWAVNQASINQEDVKRTPVPLPPSEEQKIIADELDVQLSNLSAVDSGVRTKLRSSQSVRQAMLASAFRGLLVPQHPEDEPADALLDRIAAERTERDATRGQKPKKQTITRKKRT